MFATDRYVCTKTGKTNALSLSLLLAACGGGGGALQLGNAHTAFIGYGFDAPLGDMTLSLSSQFAFSHAEGDSAGLTRGTKKGALASSFSVELKSDTLSMTLKQPTYFELGDLNLNVPVRPLAGGGVVFEKRAFSLQAPTRPFEISVLHGDDMARIGMKIETQTGHEIKAGFGYFRRF